MKLMNIAPAALKALEAFHNRPAAVPAPCYSVQTASGFSAAAETFTGAFKAIRFLPAREQNTARIYDEDGYCLYR